MPSTCLVVVDPGHFHAALVQQQIYPGLSPLVRVHAPLGPDLIDYLSRIARYNAHPQAAATDWRLDVHTGPDFLDRMRDEPPGGIAIFSGRNRGKVERIIAALEAGLHVLADKPAIIERGDLERLDAALALAEARQLVLADMMTGRHNTLARLLQALRGDPEVFGTPVAGTAEEPGVMLSSVHHLCKTVAGHPNPRPPWFFDITQQGEGLADTAVHLVDRVHETLFPEEALDWGGDIDIASASRWPTRVSLAQYRHLTGANGWPDYLEPWRRGDALDYFCNGHVDYRLRGIRVRLEVRWDWQAIEGDDTHQALYRGTRCRLELRQGRAESFQPGLYVVPEANVAGPLERRIAAFQPVYPGVTAEALGREWRIGVPDKLRIGHDAAFAAFTRGFLADVADPASRPAREPPNLLAKYYVTTEAVARSRGWNSCRLGEGKHMQADYVIVGAGSAGCVLANRLTEDPATRVILIEAGGRDWNPLIHIPVGYMKLLDHKELTWGFKAEADFGTNGRAIAYPRGRVLGGSSSINGLIYIRSQPEDYDYWAQLGNRGWGWDDVLPFFKRAERWTGEEAEIHGTQGHLTTSPMTERPEACHAIIAAAQQLGLEYRPDVNNLPRGAGDSIGWCQQTRGGRRRASAAATYLRPAKRRPNLQIITNALVHRVLFDGRRAVGVEFSREAGRERAGAAREVILSAGAIGSPHLLQLSGVGDPEVLQQAGIAVHHALSGVGRNFQDHYIARMSCYVRGLETLNERARGLGFANEVVRYLVQGKGMMTFGASLCAASVKVLPESATPDVQCVFAPASYKPGLIRRLDDRPGITGGPWQMRPLSRGYVLVRTPDPHDHPAINPRYLAEDTDQRAIVGGLKFLRRLFAAPALAPHIIEENVPGRNVQSDDELLDYARANGSTVYHASCSCMMGNHAMSVVDDQLRVHGLEGLRVVDASVMPAVSSTNTNAPTIMIAEKGAAMIKDSAREKLAA